MADCLFLLAKRRVPSPGVVSLARAAAPVTHHTGSLTVIGRTLSAVMWAKLPVPGESQREEGHADQRRECWLLTRAALLLDNWEGSLVTSRAAATAVMPALLLVLMHGQRLEPGPILLEQGTGSEVRADLPKVIRCGLLRDRQQADG